MNYPPRTRWSKTSSAIRWSPVEAVRGLRVPMRLSLQGFRAPTPAFPPPAPVGLRFTGFLGTTRVLRLPEPLRATSVDSVACTRLAARGGRISQVPG